MTSNPVVTIGPDTPVRAATELLVSHSFTAASVMEGGRVIGIVTEADLIRDQIHVEPLAASCDPANLSQVSRAVHAARINSRATSRRDKSISTEAHARASGPDGPFY
ncbi:MAG TPA: CBS domain-containing protein [Pseudonocardiaceae bacterium]|nr:CBS domain-containing protein [Pseudonocardiaceae bacterium]